MINYSFLAENSTQKSIFQRGQRLFLEGKILSKEDLILDHWRKYQVEDKTNDNATVKIPLLHLTLSREKWEKALECFNEMVTCDCLYFHDNGCCMHICGVCMSLNSEFKIENSLENVAKTVNCASKIFDQINSSSNKKKCLEWINSFEFWVNNPNWGGKSKFLSTISAGGRDILEKGGELEYFWDQIKRITVDILKNWDAGKAVYKIAIDSLLSNSDFWGEFYTDIILKQVHIGQLEDFYNKLYLAKNDFQINKIYYKFMKKAAALYSSGDKIDLTARFSNFKNIRFQDIVEFNILIENYSWLSINLRKIDPLKLLEIVSLLPDFLEEIEQIISNQIKEWVLMIDVVSSVGGGGGNVEILNILKAWKKCIGGRSEVFLETCDFIIGTLKKKRVFVSSVKLIREL